MLDRLGQHLSPRANQPPARFLSTGAYDLLRPSMFFLSSHPHSPVRRKRNSQLRRNDAGDRTRRVCPARSIGAYPPSLAARLLPKLLPPLLRNEIAKFRHRNKALHPLFKRELGKTRVSRSHLVRDRTFTRCSKSAGATFNSTTSPAIRWVGLVIWENKHDNLSNSYARAGTSSNHTRFGIRRCQNNHAQ